MSSICSEDEGSEPPSPPAVPKFEMVWDDDDLLPLPLPTFEVLDPIPPKETPPQKQFADFTQSPLEKHIRSSRDVSLLGTTEVIRKVPVILAFQSKLVRVSLSANNTLTQVRKNAGEANRILRSKA